MKQLVKDKIHETKLPMMKAPPQLLKEYENTGSKGIVELIEKKKRKKFHSKAKSSFTIEEAKKN